VSCSTNSIGISRQMKTEGKTFQGTRRGHVKAGGRKTELGRRSGLEYESPLVTGEKGGSNPR